MGVSYFQEAMPLFVLGYSQEQHQRPWSRFLSSCSPLDCPTTRSYTGLSFSGRYDALTSIFGWERRGFLRSVGICSGHTLALGQLLGQILPFLQAALMMGFSSGRARSSCPTRDRLPGGLGLRGRGIQGHSCFLGGSLCPARPRDWELPGKLCLLETEELMVSGRLTGKGSLRNDKCDFLYTCLSLELTGKGKTYVTMKRSVNTLPHIQKSWNHKAP